MDKVSKEIIVSDASNSCRVDNEENIPTKSSAANLQLSSGVPASTAIMQTFGAGSRVISKSKRLYTYVQYTFKYMI